MSKQERHGSFDFVDIFFGFRHGYLQLFIRRTHRRIIALLSVDKFQWMRAPPCHLKVGIVRIGILSMSCVYWNYSSNAMKIKRKDFRASYWLHHFCMCGWLRFGQVIRLQTAQQLWSAKRTFSVGGNNNLSESRRRHGNGYWPAWTLQLIWIRLSLIIPQFVVVIWFDEICSRLRFQFF